jgi:hypothetical protein
MSFSPFLVLYRCACWFFANLCGFWRFDFLHNRRNAVVFFSEKRVGKVLIMIRHPHYVSVYGKVYYNDVEKSKLSNRTFFTFLTLENYYCRRQQRQCQRLKFTGNASAVTLPLLSFFSPLQTLHIFFMALIWIPRHQNVFSPKNQCIKKYGRKCPNRQKQSR